MSYYIGTILPYIADDVVEKIRSKCGVSMEIEKSDSLERLLNNDDCFYYCSGTGPNNGFSAYESCKRIEEDKEILKKQFPRFFDTEIYPLIEIRKKDAVKWVDIIHILFDICDIKKMGILMYWVSNHIDECDFTVFPSDTTHLDDVTADVIMKFKPEVIHYIIA